MQATKHSSFKTRHTYIVKSVIVTFVKFLSVLSTATNKLSVDPFMKELVRRYEIGRRWLAKIMGEDPDNFTENDIKVGSSCKLPS